MFWLCPKRCEFKCPVHIHRYASRKQKMSLRFSAITQKVSQGSSPELSCMLQDSCCPCQNVCSKLLRTAPDAEQTLARLGLASLSFSFLCLLRAAAAFLSTSCTCTQHSGTVSTTYTERKLQLGMMKEQHCAPSPKQDVWE